MGRREEKTIDGVRLITSSIPVMRALGTWTLIGTIVTPALVELQRLTPAQALAVAKAVKALDVGAKDLDISTVMTLLSSIGPAAQAFFERLYPHVDTLARELLVSTIAIVDNAKFELSSQTNIDVAFGDRIGTLVKAAWWVARFNFQAFGVGLRGNGDAAPKMDSP